jgi:hypothetical protein
MTGRETRSPKVFRAADRVPKSSPAEESLPETVFF